MATRVQPSQPKQVVFGFLVTPLLPETVTESALLERMLTVREAARLLAVSTATVYKLCAEDDLPHVRVLNALRIRAAELASLAAPKARRRS